ncbi:MAG: hypothetical protein AAGF97_18270, partial [Planctomycetota bacterium]
DDETAAAEIQQRNDKHDAIPSVWLIHLPVDDLAESIRRVLANGGAVVTELEHAQSAIVRDPVGVHLALQAGT